jgi:hypothetical protein
LKKKLNSIYRCSKKKLFFTNENIKKLKLNWKITVNEIIDFWNDFFVIELSFICVFFSKIISFGINFQNISHFLSLKTLRLNHNSRPTEQLLCLIAISLRTDLSYFMSDLCLEPYSTKSNPQKLLLLLYSLFASLCLQWYQHLSFTKTLLSNIFELWFS